MHLRKAHNSLISYRTKNHRYLNNIQDKNYDLFNERKISLRIRNQTPKSPLRHERQKLIPYSSRTTLLAHQKSPYVSKLPKLNLKKDTTLTHKKIIEQKRVLTVEVPRTKLLDPLSNNVLIFSAKSKAGSSGKQIKINQDIAFISQKLAEGVKAFVVCDGHGSNGHLKRENINSLLHRIKSQKELIDVLVKAYQLTNNQLLESQINTQFSGSTVVGCFIYEGFIHCLNVGDSRALLAKHDNKKKWVVTQLSNDHKPTRQDQKQRILKAGGRIQAQKDQKGNNIGPMRVWVAKQQLPGLAMTRSFGDKAGMRAGTLAQPEVTSTQITRQDKFIAIASDGVWQYLQSKDVMNFIVPQYLKFNIEGACERVVQQSASLWNKFCFSRDDITCVVVQLNEP